MIKPIIKWPGGKSREIQYITSLIPSSYDRYIEPFFGGGALFFYLQPKKAVINDTVCELTKLYSFLKTGKNREDFEKEIRNYVTYWYRIDKYIKYFDDSFLIIYDQYKNNILSDVQFEEEIRKLFKSQIVYFNKLFTSLFCIDRESLLKYMQKSVIVKLKRIKYIVDTENKYTEKRLMNNIETAFRSGFYIHFRDIGNKVKYKELSISNTKRIANYYFIREFCYISMFRFNKSGGFNVPYGGLSYNNKDFEKKVNNLFSSEVQRLLDNTSIENMDFEDVLNKYELTPKDFVFFDPPYDSEFSTYENNSFGKEEHERLSRCIYNLQAKFILIIKETPFILNLYKNDKFKKKNIKISSFDKKYIFNIKDRHERNVKHLIIHNLKDSQVYL